MGCYGLFATVFLLYLAVLSNAYYKDYMTREFLANIEEDGQGNGRFKRDDLDDDANRWIQDIENEVETESKKTTTQATKPPEVSTTSDEDEDDSSMEVDVSFGDNERCTTENGESGYCVEYYQCDKDLIKNETLVDERSLSCPKMLQKCCLTSEYMRKPKEQVSPNVGCGWEKPEVAIMNIKDLNNINRKTYAEFGEFPWMVAVLRKEQEEEIWNRKNYIAGGSIIHPSVVVTIAHRLIKYKPSQMICRAGDWDTKSNEELYAPQDRYVRKKITHQEFYRSKSINNIALLLLDYPFKFENAPHIGVACLAPQLPAPNTVCFSMGWGQNAGDDKSYAVILKKVKVPYVESGKCLEALRKTNLTVNYNLHESHICAGGEEGVDTCKRDGGSSLVCPIGTGNDATRYAMYGMVAVGVRCGNPIPAVYSNIPNLYSWVDAKLTREGIDTSAYRY